MLFSELTECPFCGSKQYDLMQKFDYKGHIHVSFEGGEKVTDFTPELLEETVGSKAMCTNCGAFLGSTNTNKVSKAVQNKVDGVEAEEK